MITNFKIFETNVDNLIKKYIILNHTNREYRMIIM
jgi:hypothetical protein